jgi:hypothetical protein
MADWRATAKLLVLADGTIDDDEVRILRKAILADNYVDQEEIAFLVDLRNTARRKAKGGKVNANFEKLFYDGVTNYVLSPGGGISAEKTAWLKQTLYPSKKVDAEAKKFLGRLKKSVTQSSPEFNALHDEVTGAGAAPKKKAAAKKKK